MRVLITGGGGFTGSRLASAFAGRGDKVVVFDVSFEGLSKELSNEGVVMVKGDIRNWPEVLNVVRDYNIDTVFHLAAILTVPSEANPWASIDINALGTFHVLEAARLFRVKKVLFTSSIGAYGVTQDTVVDEETVQRPTNIYGVSKVFGELLGLYYHRKFGIDFRGLRLPGLLGPGVKTPGVAQYQPLVIEAAIKGDPFEVWAPEDTVIPMMYIKDAIKSLVMLHDAPEEGIITRMYHVGQITPAPTAKNLVDAVKRHYPDARITFKPDPAVVSILKTIPRTIKSDRALKEWGWRISYTLEDAIVDFIDEYKKDHLP